MTRIKIASAATCGFLGGAVMLSFLLPKEASVPMALASAPAPDELILGGMVRDFLTAHPDFATTPAEGVGHYAGTVRKYVSLDGTPIFDTNGYKVDTQWTDSSGRNIGPHMMGIYGGFGDTNVLGARVQGKIVLDKNSMIDSFDSSIGPYGIGGNYGAGAYVSTNQTSKKSVEIDDKATIFGEVHVGVGGIPDIVVERPDRVSGGVKVQTKQFDMPEIVVPEDLEGNAGDVTYDAVTVRFEGTDLTAEDPSDEKALLFDKFKLDNGAILEVEGDVRMVCDEFEVKDGSQINLIEPASLTVYVLGDHDVHIKKSAVNTGAAEWNTTGMTLLYAGDKKVKIEDKSTFLGTIVAPNGTLEIKKSEAYGAFVGNSLKVDDDGALHVDITGSEQSALNPALTVHEKFELKGEDVELDGFDSDAGPYGVGNQAPYAVLRTNATKDNSVKIEKGTFGGDVIVGVNADASEVVELKDGGTVTGAISAGHALVPIPNVLSPRMAGSLGDVEWDTGTRTISGDFHAKKLKLEGDVTVQIDGDVRMRLDDKLEMKGDAEIVLLPGATLEMYVEKDIKIENNAKINMNTGNPQLVRIGRVSVGKNGKIEMKGNAQVAAWAQGRKTELVVKDDAEFFGSFAGRKAKLEDKARWHVDMAGLFPCVVVNDTPGVAGAADNGGITSDATFSQWFRNDGTVNLHGPHRITLKKDAFDVWEYIEPAFYPVDGMLLGNEGDVHNYNFTYSIKADFTYEECGGQFVELRGGDGFWLFINGKLAIDLGGSHGLMDQYLDVDRLGLTPDQTYTFELFFAQRDPTGSLFHLRTNLDLDSDKYMPAEHVMFD